MERIESLSPAELGLTSKHPRLGTPMRMIDLCAFVADHDDFHLARVTELKRLFS